MLPRDSDPRPHGLARRQCALAVAGTVGLARGTVTDVSPVGADAFAELLAVPADRLTDVYPLRPEAD
ncbi:hypothetical protein [Streptomyces sp. 900105755]